MKLQLKDKITIWEAKAERGKYGEVKYEKAKTIMGRWQDTKEILFSNFQQTAISDSVIFSDQNIKVESYALLGESSEDHPNKLDNSYRIYKIETMQNLNNKITIYKMLLCK